MPAFSYRAINPSGKVVNGTLEGDSERQIRGQLRSQKLKPIDVQSVKKSQKKTSTQKQSWLKRSANLSAKDLTLLTRQMSSLVQSGMPLAETLQGVAKQTRKQSTQGLILEIRSRVLEGLSLARAIGEHPRSFDSMYQAMVNAGEQAGFLGPVLNRLADYTENAQFAKQKLTSAMIYPLVLMFICVAIVIALMAFVVPQLISVFARAKADLPWQTTALIAGSDFVRSYGIYCFAVLVLAFIGFKRWLIAPKNRRKWHKVLLKLPIIGHIIVQSETSRFSSTLGMLIDSGVPLLQGLRISSQTMNNYILREHAEQVATTVQEGTSLNRALDQTAVFPPLMVQMAASGEANGTLAEQLQYAARTQERELELQLSTALSILEPLTIVTMAVVIGVIMYAILSPIFGMSNLL